MLAPTWNPDRAQASSADVTRVSEGVPVRHRKAKVIGHRPALDDFRGIVVFEGQRVLGGWALVGDLADFRECGAHSSNGVLVNSTT